MCGIKAAAHIVFPKKALKGHFTRSDNPADDFPAQNSPINDTNNINNT